MIGSLLRQIALGVVGNVGEIQNAFEKSRHGGGKGLRLPEMVKLFVNTVCPLDRVYICVDAMDELLPQHRSEFFYALREIIQEAPNTRLFLTGRPYIRGELDKNLTEGAYIIHIVPNQEDIAKYLKRKMDDDGDRDPDLMTESLKNDITKIMLERASEMLVGATILAILITNRYSAQVSARCIKYRRNLRRDVGGEEEENVAKGGYNGRGLR